MSIKFSTATPVYNGMPALRRCIGSVRGQAATESLKALDGETPDGSLNKFNDLNEGNARLNATVSAEVQHIIQDGGSKDGSVEFLLAFMAQHPSTSNYQPSFCSEADKGMYDAINKAWGKSDGDILSWLNSDEQYLPGTLSKISSFFEAHPKTDVVFGNMIIVDAEGRPIAARREIDLCKRHIANGALFVFSGAMFFHRRLFDRGILKFDTMYKLAGDMDLVLHLMDHGAVFRHVDEYLSLFTADGGNLTTRRWEQMQSETQEIRAKYGGHNSAIRRLFLLDRYVKRCLRGCYVRRPVHFDYVQDESGRSSRIDAGGVGRAYRL